MVFLAGKCNRQKFVSRPMLGGFSESLGQLVCVNVGWTTELPTYLIRESEVSCSVAGPTLLQSDLDNRLRPPIVILMIR